MTEPFRTIELSDPAYERDGLRQITVKTPNLAGRGDITVWIPDAELIGQQPLPLVILLHGVYGSHWAWTLKAGAHQTANRLIREGNICPMVLAMPSDGLWGDGSGYLPHNDRYFDRWIVEDVPSAVAAALPAYAVAGFPSSSFIAGLSMGGFGALRLAATYPDRFKAAHGFSSITHTDQLSLFVEESPDNYRQNDPATESVLAMMVRNKARLPAIQFNCGTDDLLIEYNRSLHRELTEHGIAHAYSEHPGGHSWSYWQEHLADALLFFNQMM
ncbi:alpha/beta hydrolase [Fibrella forsythiae]|uniref:Esterase family protein n=1 Tax=Fibrella forsythiae TaxID=2817061 RepID=A0ABS3JNS7_9BACT|nr:alpha/beta hydrolase-fold protein [Fibrella forsythiae]MBO0951630.1 esterase family protein [Fibrella forsythiae]